MNRDGGRWVSPRSPDRPASPAGCPPADEEPDRGGNADGAADPPAGAGACPCCGRSGEGHGDEPRRAEASDGPVGRSGVAPGALAAEAGGAGSPCEAGLAGPSGFAVEPGRAVPGGAA
ncbi:hypothetical protein CC117_00570 [Parafrankia colletiae]|uniref:Uncharacterized protein n=1 Tax=Parafrankia colletiae TaxID=573497 RepID=A0A1S1RJ06_9ACTN|nr:hypothetical protein CC117_00570 [Parafrankia colletiae]